MSAVYLFKSTSHNPYGAVAIWRNPNESEPPGGHGNQAISIIERLESLLAFLKNCHSPALPSPPLPYQLTAGLLYFMLHRLQQAIQSTPSPTSRNALVITQQILGRSSYFRTLYKTLVNKQYAKLIDKIEIIRGS